MESNDEVCCSNIFGNVNGLCRKSLTCLALSRAVTGHKNLPNSFPFIPYLEYVREATNNTQWFEWFQKVLSRFHRCQIGTKKVLKWFKGFPKRFLMISKKSCKGSKFLQKVPIKVPNGSKKVPNC